VSRPFEKGDMVVSENKGIGIVISVRAMDRVAECEFGDGNTSFFSFKTGKECGFSSAVDWEDGDKIKYIRKPRKGGKEARDIVAMLANARRYGLNDLLITCGKDKKLRYKFKRIFEMGMSHILYVKAKSILGASNE